MNIINIILSFLATYIAGCQPAKIDGKYELIEYFLTAKNIEVAVVYTCWSYKGNYKGILLFIYHILN